MYCHEYYLDIFPHVYKWHLIKYIHWHIFLHLWQTTKPLNRTFVKYTACSKSLGCKPVRYRSSTLTHEHLTNISLQHGALGALSISARAKKSGSQRRAYLLLYFSGVLYPQMRPPTKQASRFRSTARTSRPSLTSWDLVWPLVFKLLCHVSSNWYLTFSLLPPLTSTSSLLHFILCLSPKPSPASAHYLCVTESGAKSNRWFTLWGKSAVKVLNETTSFSGYMKQKELLQPRNIDRAGPSNDWMQA